MSRLSQARARKQLTRDEVPAADGRLEAVAWGHAPRHPGSTVNRRIVCLDGFAVSVQASHMHYAHDSSGKAPYWLGVDPDIKYPFITFEIGNPSGSLPDSWAEYDNGGVWAWVPWRKVALMLASHGGSIAWEDA